MATIDFRFREQLVARVGGEGVSYCFQCGACVGDCPASTYTERFNPRLIMLRALLGLEGELLDEGSPIWDCTCCCTCIDRCPQEVAPFDVIMALKNLAGERGTAPEVLGQQRGAVLESGRNIVVTDLTRRRRDELGLPPLGEPPVQELRSLLAGGNGAGDAGPDTDPDDAASGGDHD